MGNTTEKTNTDSLVKYYAGMLLKYMNRNPAMDWGDIDYTGEVWLDDFKGRDGKVVFHVKSGGPRSSSMTVYHRPASGMYPRDIGEPIVHVKNLTKELREIVNMICPCCGGKTVGRQFHTLKKGTGLCPTCYQNLAALGESDSTEYMERAYGVLGVHVIPELDRKSTRLNSSHLKLSRMPSSA